MQKDGGQDAYTKGGEDRVTPGWYPQKTKATPETQTNLNKPKSHQYRNSPGVTRLSPAALAATGFWEQKNPEAVYRL